MNPTPPQQRRKVRAGQPPTLLHLVDTHQLPDARTVEQLGAASTADQDCPPGFCGFDERCSDRACPGHPANKQQRLAQSEDAQDSDSGVGGLLDWDWVVVAVAVASCIFIIAFSIGRAVG